MNKKLKRITAVILCLLIMTGTIITDNIQAKATALPVASGISSLLKAIVGTGIAYGGYKATKKQVEDISRNVSSLVGEFVVSAKKATKEDLISEDAYNAYCILQWVNNPYESALNTFAKKIYACTAEKMEEKREEIKLQLIKGGKPDKEPDISSAVNAALMDWLLNKYQNNINALENLVNGKNINNSNDLISKGIGAQAGVQVALELGFTKAISGLTDEVIKREFNADYEKAKGKYDWEKLGFMSDYDTLEISKSSTEQFSRYSNMNNRFNADYTLLSIKTGDVTVIDSFPGGVEKTALVTIRNPSTGLWKTVFLTEEQLYYFASSVKSGTYTFSEIDEMITSTYMTDKDKTFPNFPIGGINKKDENNISTGNDTFFNFFATGEYSQNPLTIRTQLNGRYAQADNEIQYIYLQKSSATVYNIGKTMNVYFWNFANETEYIGSTTALNGLEEIQPAVKPSVYTNTASEIDSKPSVTVDTNKNYDNTDEQLEDMAQDNDLDLKVVEDNTTEINGNTKGIWETVKSIWSTIKSLPRKIYNFFSGILEKILDAVKANPLAIFNYIADPLTAIETAVKNGVENIIANMPNSITNNFPSFEKIENVLDKMDLNLNTAMTSLLDIAGGRNIGQITSIFNLIENIAGDTVLGDIVTAINNLPISNVARLIENLPQKLTYGNIVTAISNLPINEILNVLENLPDTLSLGNIKTVLDTLANEATNIFTSIGSLAENITSPVINTLSSLFVPDVAAINGAINDLKSNFAFVNDFKAIVGSIIETAIEPHDYITIYNWDKANNKYDKRDSYRISFSWYAPYRPYVNAIIIALVYLIFVWRIFIKLPSIISGTGGGIETAFSAAQTYADLKNGGD